MPGRCEVSIGLGDGDSLRRGLLVEGLGGVDPTSEECGVGGVEVLVLAVVAGLTREVALGMMKEADVV